MKTNYIVQPPIAVGDVIDRIVRMDPKEAQFVSAFASYQTVLRLRPSMGYLKDRSCDVTVVLGIDMSGTSKEALLEVLSWDIATVLVKHKTPGHTFHPKLFHFRFDHRADIIVGSNNLTDGGLYKNYEAAVHTVYDLPRDQAPYSRATNELKRFLKPSGSTAYTLTRQLVDDLSAAGIVPTEQVSRAQRNETRRASPRTRDALVKLNLGKDEFPLPPPLPQAVLANLIAARTNGELTDPAKGSRSTRPEDRPDDPEQITVDAFYMTLPKLQGPNLPGEARIPLQALEFAQDLWGWPDMYTRDESPRAGSNRVYWNWRAPWRLLLDPITAPDAEIVQEVRLYYYENSSDFRFYARPLIRAGADSGDIVRIRRIDEPEAVFECVLAKSETSIHREWRKYCNVQVRNSDRRYGFA